MDGGYEISSASDDEPMRKLFLLLSPVYFGFQKETGEGKERKFLFFPN